ncbi:MAG: hypothetical protein O9972_33560, partial [Burkholderiales bacterium]|nr:hypothetical protein [Burkholderiales bacterium]
MNARRVLLLLAIAAAIGAFFAFDLDRYLTLESVKARQAELEAWVDARPFATAGAFFAIYVVAAA